MVCGVVIAVTGWIVVVLVVVVVGLGCGVMTGGVD